MFPLLFFFFYLKITICMLSLTFLVCDVSVGGKIIRRSRSFENSQE